MTIEQTYRAMFIYLDEYYKRNPKAELGQVLGEIQLMDDGRPFDPAVFEDWKEAVEKAMSK